MKGFVKNESDRTIFILQRSIGPGLSITLEEAYVVVGKKSKKRKGPSFAKWLRENYFRDSTWEFYKDEEEPYFEEEVSLQETASVRAAEGAGKNLVRRDASQEKQGNLALKIINSDIVLAKPLIDKCKDRAVLRTALAASKLRAGKEAHMRYLIRRLEQVYF